MADKGLRQRLRQRGAFAGAAQLVDGMRDQFKLAAQGVDVLLFEVTLHRRANDQTKRQQDQA